jgi:hypothetical protein
MLRNNGSNKTHSLLWITTLLSLRWNPSAPFFSLFFSAITTVKYRVPACVIQETHLLNLAPSLVSYVIIFNGILYYVKSQK